ncbi:1-aminocyclopropane-1-carboxylate oxidase homolog 1-like protein [Drosera capensis]
MVATIKTPVAADEPKYDRKIDVKAFDETKLGVKGLLDTGVTTLPPIFVNNQDLPLDRLTVVQDEAAKHAGIPIIDFSGVNDDPARRKEIVKEIQDAHATWGFFQIVNHGIPQSMLDEIREGVLKFFELDVETRRKYYSREYEKKKFVYNSNYFLYEGPVTNWRDTISTMIAPVSADPEEIPEVCRDIILEYSKEVLKLGYTMFELLSEAMGLPPNYLKDWDCGEQMMLLGHYYPPCPEPEKAIGINNHKDNDFLTILLQDEVGGLQVLNENRWVEVPFVPGALVINTGDLLQLVSNGKFQSVVHRVQSKKVGPRISVAGFFRPEFTNHRKYGPIKEILSEENPAIYTECTHWEYFQSYLSTGQDGTPALDRFKI